MDIVKLQNSTKAAQVGGENGSDSDQIAGTGKSSRIIDFKSIKSVSDKSSETLRGGEKIEFRTKFRKSHTCGSLYAKCGCSSTTTTTTTATTTTTTTTPSTKLPHYHDKQFVHDMRIMASSAGGSSPISSQSANRGHCDTIGGAPPPARSDHRKPKRLFQSYSHPDTDFVFTETNRNPVKDALRSSNNNNNEPSITTKSGRVEIKHPKRSSSPNIGRYTLLDVAIHPDILVKVSPKRTSKPKLQRSAEFDHSTSDSENSTVEDQSAKKPLTPTKAAAPVPSSPSRFENSLNAAQKYFQESGILGPIQPTPNLIRKTSKILQDTAIIEQIRKTSKIFRQTGRVSISSSKGSPPTGYDEMDYMTMSPLPSPKIPHTTTTANNSANTKQMKVNAEPPLLGEDGRIRILEREVISLKDQLKKRDSEICKLKREIHKLKSVLQQTTNHLPICDDQLLTSPTSSHPSRYIHTDTQCHQVTSSCTANNVNNNIENLAATTTNTTTTTSTGAFDHIENCSQIATASCPLDDSDDSIKEICSTSRKAQKVNQLSGPVMLKKQGVSGESCDSAIQQSNNVPIPKYDKDFRSKQLIKDAIMDNDFLKNIDSSQVRELVESMYSLDIAKGEYVIREGDIGAHLYVSAEGEFEVIKNGNILGEMGAGKAFGELAILYNCTRTASVRVLAAARLWVLDRRVFQQIMMRTGLQRIEDNVNFLRSVPLLKNLSNDVLAKISDVLEVEFYPAGTYIIRQGASGDTFFLISQGSVKVTQKLGPSTEEKEIRTLERGDYFGEQALINEDKRTANIIALAPGVECLTLDRESFTHLIGDLCELKEKNYGDENRVLAMKFSETKEIFGANVKQDFPEMELNDLEIVATLGIGGFGRVELVKSYRQNRVKTFALKCLKKQHIVDTRQEEHVYSERTIMLTCETPFICRLYRTFRDTKYVYMLLEACMGGEVWTILRDRGCFDEATTQFIIGCVLQAFEYLHSRGIIYRDLKPENLMLDERGYVKLVDFGFAKYIGNSSKTWTFCGTPEYVAPEIILNKGHDRAVDYWALGILIHELLNGAPPFTANDPMKTYNIILKGIDMIDFPKHMPRAAIMLIKKLCRDAPAERLGYQKGGIQDIKKHKWFQGFDWDGLLNLTLIPPFLRPVAHPMDTCNFDKFPVDCDEPPDELSGWDEDF